MSIWADGYEGGYESEYDSMYDQCFVFYDEDDGFGEELQEDDIALEEVPFVYCPSNEDSAEA